MGVLIVLLLAAPPGADTPNRVPELAALVKAGETEQALALLAEIGTHAGNHDEARDLVRLLRVEGTGQPPELLEGFFLALKGIGSREVTRPLVALLKHPTLRKLSVVRIGVCRALSGSADPAGVETLVDRMRDKDDRVIAAAAEAAAAYRHAKESIRKELFRVVLEIYVSNWNLKNSVDPDLKVEKARAERRWEVIERPAERSLQLLSNVTEEDPPAWQRWWNKNKNRRWEPQER